MINIKSYVAISLIPESDLDKHNNFKKIKSTSLKIILDLYISFYGKSIFTIVSKLKFSGLEKYENIDKLLNQQSNSPRFVKREQ